MTTNMQGEEIRLDILEATKEDFLHGYIIVCRDALGVVYTTQCKRLGSFDFCIHTNLNFSILKTNANFFKAVECFNNLKMKAKINTLARQT